MADIRIKDIARTVTEPKSAEYVETDHATDGSGKLDLAAWLAARRNALAPAGALAFDGTASSRFLSTLTNQNIGTDAFSVSVVFKVPSTLAAGLYPDVIALTPTSTFGNQATSFNLGLRGDTQSLGAAITGAGAFDYNLVYVPNFMANYAGKTVHVVLTRSGTTVTIYVNGVSQTLTASSGGTPPTWAGSITSTYGQGGCAYTNTSGILAGSISRVTPYNLALTPADVTEIYELGGAVPERFRFGSQVPVLANTFNNEHANWTTINSAVITDNVGYATFSGMNANPSVARAIVANGLSGLTGKNRTVRVKFDYRTSNVGTLAIPYLAATVSNTIGDNTWRSVVAEETLIASGYGDTAMITGSVGTVDLRNFSLMRVGAVCHYDADLDGIGYQLHDQSTNKLDAVITTTGVSWTKPARRGYVRGTLTWAGGDHLPKSVLGQRSFPNEAVIESITTKATVASSASGVTVGDASNAARFVAANGYTTAKKNHAVTSSGLLGGITDNDTNLTVDPDTANYTGSITVEAHYRVTEGNP